MKKNLELNIKTNSNGEILSFNSCAEIYFSPEINLGKKIQDLIDGFNFELYSKSQNNIIKAKKRDLFITHVSFENENVISFLLQDLEMVFRKLEETSEFFDRQMDFIIKVMNNENDITITDGKGIVLKVSDSYEGHFDVQKENIIGKSIYELEKTGVFSPSVTALVLKEKKKVTINQRNRHGEMIMVTGVPIVDDDNNIQYVVSFNSIDIAEISSFREKYEKLNKFLEQYFSEIKELRLKEIGLLGIISKSSSMENIFQTIINIADVNVNVLIMGETGVGKNLIAKLIHNKSSRCNCKFIELNCGAIPDNLIESELFGYEKGSFTGADNRGKTGLIELADKGTLFLDEIGELPLNLQKKLLQVIQEKKIMKVGATKYVDVDFRLITATNKDLKRLVEKREFREDLYYRLNVVPIEIPPLRERTDDILPLIIHFTDEFNIKYKKNKKITQRTIDTLINYPWPGNVRELENLIERIVLTTIGDEIDIFNLPEQVRNTSGLNMTGQTLNELIDAYEKHIFESAYMKYRTTTAMAKALGIGQSSVVRKLQKYIEGYKK
ncbi:sigma-54 interaction domain-containing protein [Sinanaerobacter chloroacetimidivorans]|jgi:transcriptional regulator with PAS, ATPase and Fis domain|uniref:HTH-type transcriptional regulatory protein TyrR n=1 Tax=Sinanaerobacter chloroacetimidivorans TaxID=2818044 RepID=A0A8J7W733_9FIRM|nr:sigma 54-interacting transcriptional regulator [Sinanaerobacter chloroacetimidivorans]MBR0600273.1 sigma 54-interacting transcriptional regulator [Sinanaerobacter chloroacetimidivorans]